MLRKLASSFLFLFIIAIITSCSTSNEVATDSVIQKRKYRKGLHVNRQHLKLHRANRVLTPAALARSLTKNEIVIDQNLDKKKAKTSRKYVKDKKGLCLFRRPVVKLKPFEKLIAEYNLATKVDTFEYYNPDEVQQFHPKAITSFISGVGSVAAAVTLFYLAFLIPYVDLLGMIIFITGGIVALTTGIKALRDIRENPKKWRGKGMATTGMIFGIAMMGISAIILSILLILILLLLLFFSAV